MAERCAFSSRPGNRNKDVHHLRTVRDLPETTSKWLQSEEIKTHVYRVFKTRRLKIDVEKILWPYYDSNMNCDVWFQSFNNPVHEEFISFFSECMSPIDFDPIDWFLSPSDSVHHLHEKEETNLTQDTRQLMVAVMGTRDQAVQNINLDTNPLVRKLDEDFVYWFESLTDMLRKSPSRLNKSAYEHLFQSFIKLFGLCCKPGDYKKLEIPYEVWSNKSTTGTVTGIKSKPDLILYGFQDVRQKYVRSVPLAVVGVKAPSWIKKSKHRPRGSQKRILSQLHGKRREGLSSLKVEYEQHSSHSEIKRTKLNDEESQTDQPDASAGSQSYSEHGESLSQTGDAGDDSGASVSDAKNVTDKVLGQNERITYEEIYGKLPPNAEIPTDEEKKVWNAFLPQLLGEVVASGSLRCDGDKRTSVAVAVIGYSVIFLNFCCQNFCCKKDHHFAEIPLTPGLGLDVFISQELCLLKKADREKICKLLLCMTTFDELPF